MSSSGSIIAEPLKDQRHRLREVLGHAAHYLPAQGPIGVFIHHNTLHAFQHLPFEEAVLEAGRLFDTEPYMSEEAYQRDLRRGRIRHEDVDDVLLREADDDVLPGRITRRALRRAMLLPGVRRITAHSVAWLIEEEKWLEAFRSDLDPAAVAALRTDAPAALWKACTARVPSLQSGANAKAGRPRDGILARHGIDIDQSIHPPLIRLTGAYLDQGIAYWPMPLRELGLLRATRRIMAQHVALHPTHLGGIGELFREQEARNSTAEEVVLDALERLGVPEGSWEAFITAELLALPGWAGLVNCLELDPTLAPHDRVPCSLMEFLALRLSYTLVITRSITGDTTSWRDMQVRSTGADPFGGVARVFDVAQLIGLSSNALLALPREEFDRLCKEIWACNELERRRLLHLAYERRHERSILIPLARHLALPSLQQHQGRPVAQVMFCIDEREESVRRALEEMEPEMCTYGAAGFFGCAVNYAGLDDPGGVALAPVVVKPTHAVRERPVADHAAVHEKRQSLRRKWAWLVRNEFVSSRTLLRGWFSTAVLGFLSIFPLTLRVLRPLAYGRIMERLNGFFLPEPRTELTFMRADEASKEATTGLLLGFSVPEIVDRVASVLGPAGMHNDLARIVVVLGHGSTSLNNPHESAHDCGACGGRRGGPNGRLFAMMANMPGVRLGLRMRGIDIPEDTWFVGGYHDTCNDNIDLYDLDLVPPGHTPDLKRVRASLDRARAMSAHERARRFEAAHSRIDVAGGLRHVQERAEHLAEPRPEYGHCTNAVCIVGRRERTRGLFFDRRAFLVSYDATKDQSNEALGRVLGAVIPVCAGISLEYYFSFVDNESYGCGTKLPHNVTGLLGVMNGYQGDIRTGLPLQMVEIHEPVRILFVVETTPDRVMSVILASPQLKEFLEKRWIRLATMDPDDGTIKVYRDGVFEPLEGEEEPLPTAPSSMAYYRGKMDHLPVARITPERMTSAA